MEEGEWVIKFLSDPIIWLHHERAACGTALPHYRVIIKFVSDPIIWLHHE